MSDYIKEFHKDPFDVSLKVDEMKNGTYLFEGEVSNEHWMEACLRIKVPQSGSCRAKLIVEKTSYSLDISSEIHCVMQRECSRTLEMFDEESNLSYKERLYLSPQDENEEADAFEGSVLDVGDILTQHIILEMSQYPIHHRFEGGKEGEFDVLDGQQEEVDDEKNPFSVLKNLKS